MMKGLIIIVVHIIMHLESVCFGCCLETINMGLAVMTQLYSVDVFIRVQFLAIIKPGFRKNSKCAGSQQHPEGPDQQASL